MIILLCYARLCFLPALCVCVMMIDGSMNSADTRSSFTFLYTRIICVCVCIHCCRSIVITIRPSLRLLVSFFKSTRSPNTAMVFALFTRMVLRTCYCAQNPTKISRIRRKRDKVNYCVLPIPPWSLCPKASNGKSSIDNLFITMIILNNSVVKCKTFKYTYVL